MAWLVRLVFVAGVLLLGAAAIAAGPGIPGAYAPLVLQPTHSAERAEFDLTPAIEQAKKTGKRLYVYLGADDCRYCRRYEAFLEKNAADLVPHFKKDYLVVDLRSSLSIRSALLHMKVGAQSLPYAQFQTAIGDERARMLVYPSVWLLDASTLKPLMQMPAGTGTFETVPEQLEILQLVQ
jgi:hypothetical protein